MRRGCADRLGPPLTMGRPSVGSKQRFTPLIGLPGNKGEPRKEIWRRHKSAVGPSSRGRSFVGFSRSGVGSSAMVRVRHTSV